MGKYFDPNLKPGEKYPTVNRILNALLMSFLIIFFFFWPIPLIIGVFSFIFWEFMSKDFRLGLILICIMATLVLAVSIFISDKYKPRYGHGTYMPGSEPNWNKYHSPEWYLHEQKMNQERREAERNQYNSDN